MASPALVAKMKSFANKLSGISVVDNASSPNSAFSKTKASLQSPAQQNKPSILPKQQVYGVPGVSKSSQLPAKYK